MLFWLGTHEPSWLWRDDVGVPLFVSARRLRRYKRLRPAVAPWALDSGGFSELSMHGAWRTSHAQYVDEVLRWSTEAGAPEWVAPQDWMCEPHMLAKTGLTVAEHQRRTVDSFVRLRDDLGPLVVPVLQGWEPAEYVAHVGRYAAAGVDLGSERLVGVGSVCRRQDTWQAAAVFAALDGVAPLHGFGVKTGGFDRYARFLASADSMAWSYRARLDRPLPGCRHRACANCPRYALRWRERVLALLAVEQLALF